MPDLVSTPYTLTRIITVMTVMREKPETKVKEGFTEEAIFEFGLELTIRAKHWKHSGCPSEGPAVNDGTSHDGTQRSHRIGEWTEGQAGRNEKAAEPLEHYDPFCAEERQRESLNP